MPVFTHRLTVVCERPMLAAMRRTAVSPVIEVNQDTVLGVSIHLKSRLGEGVFQRCPADWGKDRGSIGQKGPHARVVTQE